MMLIERLEVGIFCENCYLVACQETLEGVIIDPGDDADKILTRVEALKLKIKHILITHAHLDHVQALAEVKERVARPVFMHRDDQFLLDNLQVQAAAFGLTISRIPEVDQYINEGELIGFGNVSFNVLHTPGHSRGSVSFVTDGAAFVGDALFAGSIGRTDLPGGDFETLIASIRSKLFPLGDETVVYSGHGPETTIGREKASNPFLQG